MDHDTRTPAGTTPAGITVPSAADDLWVDPAEPWTLRMRGELDLGTVRRFCRVLHPSASAEHAARALTRAGVRVVDAGAVTFADSAAVDLICALHQQGGTRPLQVRDPRGAVRRVLDVTGVAALVDLHP
ncbi:STAS domain-containing protein [Cellulomonas hominis]|uniref:STAS domain-containing protein n=1 Tax=Cellulomonas hominis TaxID=156981 RepID=UPI001BA3E647|nr:STAS domain-containing protein [Cellulomonas hominis]VTR76160.1 hypothetical protein CHMI_00916 [Cellulomonas hominis]